MLFYARIIKKNSTYKDDNDVIYKKDINYPLIGYLHHLNISCVEIFDLSNEKEGLYGLSKIVNGGPGYKNVTIRLESYPGYGFDFLIRIFGSYRSL